MTGGYRVINPATGVTERVFASLDDAGVDSALLAAQTGFEEWRQRSVDERAAAMLRAGELFRGRYEEIASAISTEMGKSHAEALAELELSAGIFDYYGEHGPRLNAKHTIDVPSGDSAVVEKLPLGALLGIMPWNFPAYQTLRFAIPNMVAGNVVMIKPAESCPLSAELLQGVFDDAGLPFGAVQTVYVSHEQVERIIGDVRVSGVSLTGSERAGAAVAAIAARHLKKSVLELGGADAYVVLDSADVRASARAAWSTRLGNLGQSCNSNKRIIVSADLYDEFVDEVTKLAQAERPRAADDPAGAGYGPVSTRQAAERLAEQVQSAVGEGAKLLAGGHVGGAGGAHFAPAVLVGVTPQMRAHREEIFGPVAVIYSVASDEEAIALANDSDFGLGGAVFSQDEDRARAVAERLESGMVHVNVAAAYGASLPFGGGP